MYNYYVYAYLRENNTPYYIGKGRNKRAYSKNHGIKPPKDKDRIVFWQTGLTEQVAFNLEIKYIKLFGRKDLGTGILRNLTNGGEGVSGPMSEENKQIRRRPYGQQKNPNPNRFNKRDPFSEEHKEKLRGPRPNYIPWNRGLKTPEETIQKIRGRIHTEEEKIKIKESRSKQIFSEKTQLKKSVKMKNKIWVNNKNVSKRVETQEIPDGFIIGRLKRLQF